MQLPGGGPHAGLDRTIRWLFVSASAPRSWWPVGGHQSERRSSVGDLEREGVTVQHFHCWQSRRFLAKGFSSGHRGISDCSPDTAAAAGRVAAGAAAGTVGFAVAPALGRRWWGTC